ncbi:MAG: guanylate kinase [Alphaproteobacteria bacterium]|jgi:guanylate kinase|nr:guanylate kinase [Rhodospirillaceae bacterium]MDP6404703.1 guanylate kinase [Alphaproteobacteria bacterium]MDP6620911.1 guanylate kinase [Alphaproteobacteria bacterium]|tara:strand:+ start:142 stop:780 length:639 start_codon:yes stop_codon:yes gene_type:complete
MSPREIGRRGLMLALSSPSGAGKTTLAKGLLAQEDNIAMSISATTRPPRDGEIEGRDYHFVDAARFEEMVADRQLLESATVFGHNYGTPAEPIEAALSAGTDILFDIDWQGMQQLRQRARADLVSVFILPPSAGELERRLRERGLDAADVVASRMAQAANEMSHWPEYDYIVVNDDMAQAQDRVRTILYAERLKRERQTGLVDFVKLLSDSQ